MTSLTRNPNEPRAIRTKNEPIEKIQADLGRPLPRLSFRLSITIIVTVALFSWGMAATGFSGSTLVEGVPNIVDFVTRLFPMEFEYEQGSVRAYTFPGFESRIPETVEARLREAEPAEPEALEALADDQFVTTLYRTPDRRFHETYPDVDANVVVEEVPFILQEGQFLYLDRPSSDPYILQEGQRFVDRYAIGEDQQLISKLYIINRGEIFLGWPVLIQLIVETVQIALIGTAGAVLLSIPFGLLAARNVSPHPIVYQVTRVIMNAGRAIPELIYALIFVAAVGLGPFPGVLALIVGSIGGMGKLYAESIEAIDPQQVAAVRATGAGPLQIFNYSVIPQAFPLIASYSLILFESNVRAASILGIVGAGGVGFVINKYIGLFQYQKLMGSVFALLIVVTIIDRLSDYFRKRII
ncbi:MAG: hypothetical protein OHK0046_25750 [Anaerolineae bacterium]